MKTEEIIKTLQAQNDWRRDKISTTDYLDTITANENRDCNRCSH